MRIFILIITFCCFYASKSFAYLDPGTGSFILSMIVAFFAGLVTFYNTIKIKIKNFFSKKNKTSNNKKN